MIYQELETINLVIKACDIFMKHDNYLLRKEVNERSLTHRLAVYLETLFPEWHVDCEYNKLGDDSKRINVPCEYEENGKTDDLNGKTVYPDIIIHRRGGLGKVNNLIVIEEKKSINDNGRKKDECKLKTYKTDSHYLYQFAFFIDFIIGIDPGYKLLIMNADGELKPINS